jgi:hypothetical protein
MLSIGRLTGTERIQLTDTLKRSWGFAPVIFGPGTLWRTWGTRPLPEPYLAVETGDAARQTKVVEKPPPKAQIQVQTVRS